MYMHVLLTCTTYACTTHVLIVGSPRFWFFKVTSDNIMNEIEKKTLFVWHTKSCIKNCLMVVNCKVID